MTYQLPDSLSFVCLADGRPRPGLAITLTLVMRQKNPFHLIVGPTDSRGALTVTRSEMENWSKGIIQLFPMDYLGPDEFAGEIQASPMGLPQLQAALHAFESYHHVMSYPADFKKMLLQAWQSLYQQPAKRIEIRDVVIVPPQSNCRIHTESLNLAA